MKFNSTPLNFIDCLIWLTSSMGGSQSTHSTIINFILNQSNKRQLFVFVLLIDEMKWWVDELLSCRPPPNKPQINEFHSHENSFDLLVLFGLAARGVSSLAPREMKRLICSHSIQTIQLFNHSSLNWFALLACLLSLRSIGRCPPHNPLREQTAKGKSINSIALPRFIVQFVSLISQYAWGRRRSNLSFNHSSHSQREEWMKEEISCSGVIRAVQFHLLHSSILKANVLSCSNNCTVIILLFHSAISFHKWNELTKQKRKIYLFFLWRKEVEWSEMVDCPFIKEISFL